MRSITSVFVLLAFSGSRYSLTAGAAPVQAQYSQGSPLGTEDDGNRNGAFQTLANGSQDLAALVGLFATDGVERYTIDYTLGCLPPATAPLSLLGLLGYVRALMKLTLGVEFCERIGFSTVSLQSYVGVRRFDVAHRERVVDIHYLERTCIGDAVQWSLVKTVPHIPESMPMISGGVIRAEKDRRPREASFALAMCQLPQSKGTASVTFSLYALFLAFAASLSSFPILLSKSSWTWTRLFATAGLPASVLLGGLPWCLVCITEHLPFEPCDWFRADWKDTPSGTNGSADESGRSLDRKDSFAYFAKEDHFYIFDCRVVGKPWMWLTRLASCCAAVGITVAYPCQYIELRSASPRASGIWLSLQGTVAILRIVVWSWAPKLFGFGNNVELSWTDQRDYQMKNSFTELEITLC